MKGITVTLTKEQKYKKIGKLGEGMFGAVEKAENQKTGEIVAIKEMNLSLFNSKPRLVEMLKSEIKALTTIRHPNLLHLLDHFTKQQHQVVVYELCEGGTMKNYLLGTPQLEEDKVLNYILQVLKCLQVLHDNNIIHRDIKPDNILFKDVNRTQVKVADLGFCTMRGTHTDSSIIGSPGFLAPEVFNQKLYSPKSDIYATGIMLYEIIMKKLPFTQKQESELAKFKSTWMPKKEELPSEVSRFLFSILCNMVHPTLAKRVDAKTLVKAIQSHLDISQSKIIEQENALVEAKEAMAFAAEQQFNRFLQKTDEPFQASSFLPKKLAFGNPDPAVAQKPFMNPIESFKSKPVQDDVQALDKNVVVLPSTMQPSKKMIGSLPTTSETSKNPSFTNQISENLFQGHLQQPNAFLEERQTNFIQDSTHIAPQVGGHLASYSQQNIKVDNGASKNLMTSLRSTSRSRINDSTSQNRSLQNNLGRPLVDNYVNPSSNNFIPAEIPSRPDRDYFTSLQNNNLGFKEKDKPPKQPEKKIGDQNENFFDKIIRGLGFGGVEETNQPRLRYHDNKSRVRMISGHQLGNSHKISGSNSRINSQPIKFEFQDRQSDHIQQNQMTKENFGETNHLKLNQLTAELESNQLSPQEMKREEIKNEWMNRAGPGHSSTNLDSKIEQEYSQYHQIQQQRLQKAHTVDERYFQNDQHPFQHNQRNQQNEISAHVQDSEYSRGLRQKENLKSTQGPEKIKKNTVPSFDVHSLSKQGKSGNKKNLQPKTMEFQNVYNAQNLSEKHNGVFNPYDFSGQNKIQPTQPREGNYNGFVMVEVDDNHFNKQGSDQLNASSEFTENYMQREYSPLRGPKDLPDFYNIQNHNPSVVSNSTSSPRHTQDFKQSFHGHDLQNRGRIPFEKKNTETYGTIGYGNNYGNSFINAKLKASKAAASQQSTGPKYGRTDLLKKQRPNLI